MSYELTDYQGNKLSVSDDKAIKIAEIAGLVAIEVNGRTHFINPNNIAGIKPEVPKMHYKTIDELGINTDRRSL